MGTASNKNLGMTGVTENRVVDSLARWMAFEVCKRKKANSTQFAKEIRRTLPVAQGLLKQALTTGSVQYFRKKGDLIAVLMIMKKISPRIRGEKLIFFEYDPLFRRSALEWLNKLVKKQARSFPVNTCIGIQSRDESSLDEAFKQAGFCVKYQILEGVTNTALTELKRTRNPLRNIDHLNLEIRKIENPKEVDQVIALQKLVFSKNREHGFFAHTQMSLKRDRHSYLDVLRKKNGLFLGIYKKAKLLGFACAVIKETESAKKPPAGISMCFHPTIQGLGISKTCYLLLLEFLKKKRVHEFRGGTSQGAIKHLGRILKRRHRYTIFLKYPF